MWVGRASQAVDFYVEASRATVVHRVGEGDDIAAQLSIGKAAFWVASAGPDIGRFSPPAIGGATGRTLLVAEDPEAVADRAVRAGAAEKSPVWPRVGDRQALQPWPPD